jgi:hypothetical protein
MIKSNDESPKKALQRNGLPTEFVKWREIAADRNQWRAVFGSKILNAKKDLPTTSRQIIWAESFDTAIHPHECKNLHGSSR